MGMELKHDFTVPASVEDTWAHFNDIAAVAECFPGATVTGVEEGSFEGSVKVKLGPIALVYNGAGTFLEKDESARRMVIEAKGKDKRGNGTAGAHVVASMAPDGEGTRVEVTTDLNVTGKPAQFGRGVMQDVSDKLLGQFVQCLEQRMGVPEEEAPTPAAPGVEETPSPAPAAAADSASAVAEAATERAKAAPESAPPSSEATRPRPVGTGAPTAAGGGDALDLGATVLPVLVKSYWKQVLGALLVLLVIRRLLRRGG